MFPVVNCETIVVENRLNNNPTITQKIVDHGLLIYAGQQKIHDEDERLKLEKIANEIGEYWGLEESVAGYPELFEEITLQGLCRYASEMQYTHGETERERIKEVLDLVYEMKKHWSE